MLKLAILGCGRISQKHVEAAIANQDRIQLVAVCDIVRQNAVDRADQYHSHVKNADKPRVYTDYSEMIKNEDIDLVSICTESGYHAEHAINCMNAGKNVIVEKPMALSIKDAEDMIDAGRKNNVKLCVTHQNRFNPSVQKLRKALDDGRFGRIIAGNARILWNRGRDYYSQAPWRGTYELDGGCLMNQCIHNIDLLQWMLGGQVKWLNGDVDNFMHPYIEAEDYGSIQIRFENGAIGNVEGTICIYPKNLEETLTIIGEKGIVSIGGIALNKIETWHFEDLTEAEESTLGESSVNVDSVYGNGHIPLYRDVIDAVENDTDPYINGQDGKKAMEIILAAYQSSREGSRFNFPVSDIASIDFKHI